MMAMDARIIWRGMTTLPPAFEAKLGWATLTKQTVKRFARGNIAAQTGSILLPVEQEEERTRATSIARRWKARYAAKSR